MSERYQIPFPLTDEHFRIDSCVSLIPDLKNGLFADLRQELQFIDWNTRLGEKPVDQLWETFYDTLTAMIHTYIPFKERRPLNQSCSKWLGKEDRKKMYCKRDGLINI